MIRIRRRIVMLAFALAAAVPSVFSQQAAQAPLPAAVAMPGQWLQGYVKTVSGDTLVYPWAYPGQTRTPAQPRDDRQDERGVAGRARAGGRGGRAPHVSLACGHRVRVRRACLLLRHQRRGRGDVQVRPVARRSRVDRDRHERRRAVVQDDARRHVQRAVRLHVGDGAEVALRDGRPAVLGDRRGRREPGLLPRPRGAGADVRARACGGGGVRERRARDSCRDQHRARPRGRQHRGGRRPGQVRDTAGLHEPADSRRAQHGPAAARVRHRRQRRSRVPDARAHGGQAPRAPPAAPLPRGHRLLGPAAGGRAEAVEEPARRRRTRPQDRVVSARGALQVERRGAVVGGELPEAGPAGGSGGVSRGGARRGDRAPGERHEPPHGPGDARGTAALDVRVAPPAGRLRPRAHADGHALGHSRPELDVRGRALGGRRALLQQRAELHARPARRRRPHRLHAEGPRRQAVLVGVALGRGAAALLDGGARLLLVPRPQHGPHDRPQP